MKAWPASSPASRSALLMGCLLCAAHAAVGQVQRIPAQPSSPPSSPQVGSTSRAGHSKTPDDPVDASESDDSGDDDAAQAPGIHSRPATRKKVNSESWAVEGYATCGGAQVVDDPKGAQRAAETETTWHFLGSAERDGDADHEEFHVYSGAAHGEATTKQGVSLSAAGLSAGGDEFAQGRFWARLRLDFALEVQDLLPNKAKKSPYTAVLTDPGGCITVAGRKPLSVRMILQLNSPHQEGSSR